MSLDVQSLLNSYSSLPQAPDVAGQAANMWSSIPSIHGVDLSNVAPVSVPFQVTAADFAKTPGLPSSAPSSASSPSGGGGGLFSDIGHGISHAWNFLGSVGNGVTGMWESLLHGGDPVGDVMGLNGKPAVANPDQANQYANQQTQLFNQSVDNNLPSPLRGVTKFSVPFALQTLFSPQSLALGAVPVGRIATALKLPEALSAAKVTAMKVPGALPAANVLNTVFKPISGARQSFVDAVSRMHGSTQSGSNQIMNQLQNVFKDTTPEQRIALTHALESTAPGTALSDPTLEALRQQIEPIMAQSTKTALDRGLINGTINPDEFGVGRYIPHVSASKLDDSAEPFTDISLRKTGVDAGKARGLEGTIQALNGTGDNKLFEDDLAKVLGFHLGQANKSIAIRDLIDHSMQNGIEPGGEVAAGDIFPGTTQKAVEYSHDGRTVLLPESEAHFLKGLNVGSLSGISTLGKAYRGSVNFLNKAMFFSNPLLHIVNNLGTQTLMHDPEIFKNMPKYMGEAFKGVQPGSMMDDALKSGAMHLTSEIGKTTGAKDMANALVQSLDRTAPTLSESPLKWLGNKVASGWNQYNQITPNMEKVFRSAAYERGLEKGMTPEQATSWVRSMYGGNAAPGAASTFEKGMTTAMPFYNWTKTAIGSNIKNAAVNPFRYVVGANALNSYNKAVTGHGMGENHNPLSIGLPWKDKNGNQEYWTLYAPPFDVAKLAKDVSQNGLLGGLGDFALTRANPIFKFPLQMGTHEQNPFAATNSKYSVDPYAGNPLVPPQAHERGILFGDKGPKAPDSVAQLLQDISNPISDAMQVGSESPRDAILSRLFGGSVSAPNPASQVKEQNYNMRQWLSQLKSYEKKQAQSGQ